MRNNMNLTLKRNPGYISVESVIKFINELMYCLKPDNKVNGVKAVSSPETTGLSVFSEFLKIRKNRKAFEKLNIESAPTTRF